MQTKDTRRYSTTRISSIKQGDLFSVEGVPEKVYIKGPEFEGICHAMNVVNGAYTQFQIGGNCTPVKGELILS